MSEEIEKPEGDEEDLRRLYGLREAADRHFEKLQFIAQHRFMFDPEFSLRVKTAMDVFAKKGEDVDPFTLATALHVAMEPIGVPES